MSKKPKKKECKGEKPYIHSIPLFGIQQDIRYTYDMEPETAGDASTLDVIRLNANRVKDVPLESVLLHEIIHRLFNISGQSELYTNDQEEAIVLMLERGLFPIINFKKEFYS